MQGSWSIVDTPCYPCRYKIVQSGYVENNSSTEFFETRKEAEDEIARRVVVKEVVDARFTK